MKGGVSVVVEYVSWLLLVCQATAFVSYTTDDSLVRSYPEENDIDTLYGIDAAPVQKSSGTIDVTPYPQEYRIIYTTLSGPVCMGYGECTKVNAKPDLCDRGVSISVCGWVSISVPVNVSNLLNFIRLFDSFTQVCFVSHLKKSFLLSSLIVSQRNRSCRNPCQGFQIVTNMAWVIFP